MGAGPIRSALARIATSIPATPLAMTARAGYRLSSRSTPSGDGRRSWRRFYRGLEMSGYHHNVRGGLLMLRPCLYSAATGSALRDGRCGTYEGGEL